MNLKPYELDWQDANNILSSDIREELTRAGEIGRAHV